MKWLLLVFLTSCHSFFGSLSRFSSSCPGLENQLPLTAFLFLTFQSRHSSVFLLSSVHTFLLKHISLCSGVLQSWLLSVNKLHTSWGHRQTFIIFTFLLHSSVLGSGSWMSEWMNEWGGIEESCSCDPIVFVSLSFWPKYIISRYLGHLNFNIMNQTCAFKLFSSAIINFLFVEPEIVHHLVFFFFFWRMFCFCSKWAWVICNFRIEFLFDNTVVKSCFLACYCELQTISFDNFRYLYIYKVE